MDRVGYCCILLSPTAEYLIPLCRTPRTAAVARFVDVVADRSKAAATAVMHPTVCRPDALLSALNLSHHTPTPSPIAHTLPPLRLVGQFKTRDVVDGRSEREESIAKPELHCQIDTLLLSWVGRVS